MNTPWLSATLIAVVLLITQLYISSVNKKELSTRERIQEMVIDAFFLAILLAMTFVPNLGFIAVTPFVSVTLMHLPVLLGAMLFGWKKGLLYGFMFGIASYINALTAAGGFNTLFAYPWTAIPPRVIFGLVSGIIFSLLRKLHKGPLKGLSLSLACALLTVLHTCLVFLDLFIFFPETISSYFGSSSPVASGTSLTFLLIILLGMAGEAVVAGVIIPPLYAAVSQAVPLFRKRLSKRK